MRVGYGCIALWSLLPACAHAQHACSAAGLTSAAARVEALRHRLHTVSVPSGDPKVPPPVQTDVAALKDALAAAAEAAFACTPPDTDPQKLQADLAAALHANLAPAGESVESANGRDVGPYGADLAVQVLALSNRPQIVEVDFRFGIECGDDNLLLIYGREDGSAQPWKQRLRWTHTGYSNVREALGDFVMLTPLTGSYSAPRWRFVVAHGQPGCGEGTRLSAFDLDLLSPTADPGSPRVDWHFDHAYTAGEQLPRLQTTEDSIDFRLSPTSDAAKKAGGPEVYRFHLAQNGRVEPGPSTTPTPVRGPETTTAHASGAPPTRSPR